MKSTLSVLVMTLAFLSSSLLPSIGRENTLTTRVQRDGVALGSPRGDAPVPAALPSNSAGQGLEPKSSVTPCWPNDAAEPQSASELNARLFGYLSASCTNRFFSALDEIYKREERNEAWAPRLEETIHSLKAHLASMRIEGECHTSVCRYVFGAAHPGSCSRLVGDFDRPLIDSGIGTDLEVSVAFRHTPTGCTRYILSTVIPPPPAYFEPLRQKMEDGP